MKTGSDSTAEQQRAEATVKIAKVSKGLSQEHASLMNNKNIRSTRVYRGLAEGQVIISK